MEKIFHLMEAEGGGGVFPILASVQHVKDYILYLKHQGLAISLIRTQLAAILTFHLPVDNRSLFSNLGHKVFEGLGQGVSAGTESYSTLTSEFSFIKADGSPILSV